MAINYYEIDTDGQIIGQFDAEPEVQENFIIVHASPPPKHMLKPRWTGTGEKGAWVDHATRSEHETRIDEETDSAIGGWARERGKNEAYYINCGIRIAIENIAETTNIDHRHYQEYRSFVEKQKEIGKTKKSALMQ